MKSADTNGLRRKLIASVVAVFFILGIAVQARAEYWSHLYQGLEGEKFQNELDTLTNSKRIRGNEVVIYPEANADFEKRMDMMSNASSHIHCYTLLLRSADKTGPATAAKMIAKATLDKCETNFIYQPLSQILMSSPTIVTAMSTLGVNCRAYWPKNVNILNLYRYILLASHKKILLCDDPNYGLVAMVGGRNIGDEYLCDIPDPQPGRFANQWRDTDEVIYGPATIELEQSFIFSFNEMSAKKFKLNPNDVKYRPEVNTPSKGSDLEMRIVENEPDRNGGKGIFDVNTMYKELFKHAKNSIDIETPYFIPTDDFIKLLLETANRGVKIRVLTNSENTNDVGTPLFLGGAYFWEPLFKTGNFRLYLWDVERSVAAPELFRTMHSKILIVDNAVFMPGSWNFEARSIIWNNEFAFPINDPGMSQKATEMYETDISTPGVYEMTLEKYNAKFTSKDRFLMSLLSKLNMFL